MSKGMFYYSEAFQGYNMGTNHPMKPIRLRKTFELLREYGAFETIELKEPEMCTPEVLGKTHREDFIRAVEYLSSSKSFPYSYTRYGFGTGDNPVFPGIYEASLLYTGASLGAATDIVEGRASIAMNIAGGLHHAHYAKAAGFCVFNDCAVALTKLRERFERVAYVDIDVHHGDGVQELFYEDPSVLTLSIHETGQKLFPGTGYIWEAGDGEGKGYSVNVPVWPYTNDEQWLGAWRSIALPILKAYQPEAIVVQLGTDAHLLDPLAHVALTVQGWLEAVKDVISLGTPIVALGGGGYNMTTVPRMWAAATSELFGLSLADETPDSYAWKNEMPRLLDTETPDLDADSLDEAARLNNTMITEAQRVLFPTFGL